MLLRAVHFVVRGSGLTALLTLGLAASAQQAIQFTKPANQDPKATANTYVPPSHKSSSDFNAPKSLFGGDGATASFDELPAGPTPAMPNSYTRQWQKILQDRKNWALMTPEMVLGVPTPESILGIVPKEDSKLSPEEGFLQRQDRQLQMNATNGLHGPEAGFSRNDDPRTGQFQDRNERSQFASSSRNVTSDTSAPGTAKLPNSFLGPNSGNQADPNQPSDSTWASPFGAPQLSPQSTLEQLANMERFRALMEPPPSEKAPATASLFQPRVAAPDPNLQAQPLFNPMVRSLTPVENDIAKPTGLTPLAGVTGPAPTPTKKPALVQPPPWMSQSPQNSTLPQRQF